MEEWQKAKRKIVTAHRLGVTHALTNAAHLAGPEVARPQTRAVLLLLLSVVGGQGHHRVASLRHPVVEQTRDHLLCLRFVLVFLLLLGCS